MCTYWSIMHLLLNMVGFDWLYACWVIFHACWLFSRLTLKVFFPKNISVKIQMDWVHIKTDILVTKCLQRLSADGKVPASKERVNFLFYIFSASDNRQVWLVIYYEDFIYNLFQHASHSVNIYMKLWDIEKRTRCVVSLHQQLMNQPL